MPHFFEGILHAESDDFLGIGSTSGEAGQKFVFAWGHDKDVNEGRLDSLVGTSPNLGGSLHIDIHDHIRACSQVIQNLRFEGAVEIPVNLGVL